MSTYKISETERKTVSWWYHRRDKIDFSPPYQRKGGLWSPYDRAYLIDSMINGFDIPKLYLADFTWGDSSPLNPNRKMYAVIDGKQRLETIFAFFSDEVALNDDFKYLENPTLHAAGMKYSDLQKVHPELAEKFVEFNLAVVTVVTKDEEIINELFVRLNRSKTLTGAEIRNAMKGAIPIIIRKISEHEFFTNYVTFSSKRGQDKNAAAKLFLFEYHDKPRDTKKKGLDEFATMKDYDQKQLELAYRNVLDTLQVLCTVFLPKDTLLKSAGLIPVYYWFLRNLNPAQLPTARAFFARFDKERRESPDSDFQSFDLYNRSTNDEISFRERIKILERKYSTWHKPPNTSHNNK